MKDIKLYIIFGIINFTIGYITWDHSILAGVTQCLVISILMKFYFSYVDSKFDKN